MDIGCYFEKALCLSDQTIVMSRPLYKVTRSNPINSCKVMQNTKVAYFTHFDQKTPTSVGVKLCINAQVCTVIVTLLYIILVLFLGVKLCINAQVCTVIVTLLYIILVLFLSPHILSSLNFLSLFNS